MKRKAIFLDRDGTIIEDKGYINDIKDVEFYDFTFDSLRKLQKEFLLFIITNQEGIALGKISPEELDNVHSHILNILKENGITIQEIYTCPHTKKDKCLCRKPKPYFVKIAKQKYDLDLSNSYVIGDHPSDMYLAENAKTKGVYVLTGHGLKHLREFNIIMITKVGICKNIKKATKDILLDRVVGRF
jgi:D-glycero-D-manno-heptose 1,7-bisphosphate phosphatase